MSVARVGPKHRQMQVLKGAGPAAMALVGAYVAFRPHLISDIGRHSIAVRPPRETIECGLGPADDSSLKEVTTTADITASGNRG